MKAQLAIITIVVFVLAVGTAPVESSVSTTPPLQTKTIEDILDPLTQDAAQLVVAVEESGSGGSVPILTTDITSLVGNVVPVIQTIERSVENTKDDVFKAEVPPVVAAVDSAAEDLESAAKTLRQDPASDSGKQLVISGTQGILKGAADLLRIADQSEVRKTLRSCHDVMSVLALTEVVESPEDRTMFVTSLSEAILELAKKLEARSQDLSNVVDSDDLGYLTKFLKEFTRTFIASIDVFVTISSNGGFGLDAARASVNLTSATMLRILEEAVQVLQMSSPADAAPGHGSLLTATDFLRTAQSWLITPIVGNPGLELVIQGRLVAESLTDSDQAELVSLCDAVDELSQRIENCYPTESCRVEDGRTLKAKLLKLRDAIDKVVSTQVGDIFLDTTTTINEVWKSAKTPAGDSQRESAFEAASERFLAQASDMADIALLIAEGKVLVQGAQKIRDFAPLVVFAGRTLLLNPGLESAAGYFETVRAQFKQVTEDLLNLVDRAIDPVPFLETSMAAIESESDDVTSAMSTVDRAEAVAATTFRIVKRVKRVMSVTKKKAENSGDVELIDDVNYYTDGDLHDVNYAIFQAGRAFSRDVSVSLDDWYAGIEKLRSVLDILHSIFIKQRQQDSPTFDMTRSAADEMPPPELQGGTQGPIMQAALALYVETAQWISDDNDPLISRTDGDNDLVAWANELVSLLTALDTFVSDDVKEKRRLIYSTMKQMAAVLRTIVWYARDVLAAGCLDSALETIPRRFKAQVTHL